MDAIELEAREVSVAGITAHDAKVRLDLLSDQSTRLRIDARELVGLPEPAGKFSNVTWVCGQPVVAEPRFGCDAGRLTAQGGPTGTLDMQVAALLRSDTGVTTFSGKDLKIIGTTASFDGRLDDRSWQVKASTGAATVSALRKFVTPWFQLPADITSDGKVRLSGTLANPGTGLVTDGTAQFEAVDLTNPESTLVADKAAATAHFHSEPKGTDSIISVDVQGTAGQALVNPILFDFGKNRLDLAMRGRLSCDVLTLDSFHMVQKDLLDVDVAGRVNLAAETPALTGEVTLNRVEFPAAFVSYVQILLAASVLGDSTTSGSLSGTISVVAESLKKQHVLPAGVDLRANKGSLNLVGMNGDIYWSPAGRTDARVSKLGWKSGGAYGLSGGAAELEFIAYGANFALTRPAKLPIFDGALAIDNFAMGNLGEDDMEVSFKGTIEPISMPLLAKAFGWPEFSGTLAASIPGVHLRNDVLTFDGNVESDVFGGHIVGSNIRLQDPLGNFPQFFADVRARNLDLGLVTDTFEVGSITGKLEVDVLGLELFAWSPQAFDARLATPQGDKSRHRISAKAVSSLSNVGGGGGGVVQALQSGLLKFFDEYNYDKLGIRCRLRGDVCEMSGIEPAPNGYYIVKGAGIPRIDIVGNQGRVNWNQLMSSIPKDFSGAKVQ